MTALEAQIEQLAAEELRRGIEKFALFHSPHEAYAVIKEELEEAEDELKSAQMSLSLFWTNAVKVENKFQPKIKDICLTGLYQTAIRLSAEAVQVAAMAKKAKIGEVR